MMTRKFWISAFIGTLTGLTNPAHAYFVQMDLMNDISVGNQKTETVGNSSFTGPIAFEYENNIDLSHSQLNLQFFFKDVSSKSGPWQEAAFLDKAGSAFIGYSATDYDNDIEYTTYSAADTLYDYKNTGKDKALAAGARIIVGQFIVEPAYHSLDSTLNSRSFLYLPIALKYKTDGRDIQLGVGSYIGNHHEIVFTAGKNDSEEKVTGIMNTDREARHFNLRYKGVIPTGSRLSISPYALLGYSKLTENSEAAGNELTRQLGVTIYPMKNLGIGPEIRISNLDTEKTMRALEYSEEIEAEYTDIFINFSYMPTESFMIKLSLQASVNASDSTSTLTAPSDYAIYSSDMVGVGLGLNTSFNVRF